MERTMRTYLNAATAPYATEKNNNKNLFSAIDKTHQDFNQVISEELKDKKLNI
jgi:hypothetical protein